MAFSPNTSNTPLDRLGVDPYMFRATAPDSKHGLVSAPPRPDILAVVGVSLAEVDGEFKRTVHFDYLGDDWEENKRAVDTLGKPDIMSMFARNPISGGLREVIDSAFVPAFAAIGRDRAHGMGGIVLYRGRGTVEATTVVFTPFVEAMKRETRDLILKSRGKFRNIGRVGMMERQVADRMDRAVRVNHPADFNRNMIGLVRAITLGTLPEVSEIREELLARIPKQHTVAAPNIAQVIQLPTRERWAASTGKQLVAA